VDLNLLEHECLRGFLSRAEVSKSVVALARDPAAHNRVAILENTDVLAEFFQSGVEKFHELLRREILRNIADVKLAFRLVMIGEVRLLLLAPVAAQDFMSAHDLLAGGRSLSSGCLRWLVVEAARKVTFLIAHAENATCAKFLMSGGHASFLLATPRAVAAAPTA